MSKRPEFTFKAEMSIRQVLEEVRMMNAGRPRRAYLRFRVHYTAHKYRKLLEGKEKQLAKEAMLAAHQVGAKVVAVRFTAYTLEVDYLCPAEVGCERTNRAIARHLTAYYKRNYPGIGGEDSNGVLFGPNFITYTMESPLLERPHEFETL
jgi:hypothetical protein